MIILKQAVIDLVDCNSTLALFGSETAVTPLSLAPENVYTKLYSRIATDRPAYKEVRGEVGRGIEKLKPVYRPNKYWSKYHFSSRDTETYAEKTWKTLTPIEARLTFRVGIRGDQWPAVKMSPVPRVLLYPFGWSTWLSVLITGEHSLEELAEILQHLSRERAYVLDSELKSPRSLDDLFQRLHHGIQHDVFGEKSNSLTLPKTLAVTTVLDKYGGTPALKALSTDQEVALRRLVCPDGHASTKQWKQLALSLPMGTAPGNLDYVLRDGSAFFIWADHRLRSGRKNRTRLRCYHNNTVFSLLQARQLIAFLRQALGAPEKTEALAAMAVATIRQIEAHRTPGFAYRNRCLLSFLEGDFVEGTVTEARREFQLT